MSLICPSVNLNMNIFLVIQESWHPCHSRIPSKVAGKLSGSLCHWLSCYFCLQISTQCPCAQSDNDHSHFRFVIQEHAQALALTDLHSSQIWSDSPSGMINVVKTQSHESRMRHTSYYKSVLHSDLTWILSIYHWFCSLVLPSTILLILQ